RDNRANIDGEVDVGALDAAEVGPFRLDRLANAGALLLVQLHALRVAGRLGLLGRVLLLAWTVAVLRLVLGAAIAVAILNLLGAVAVRLAGTVALLRVGAARLG